MKLGFKHYAIIGVGGVVAFILWKTDLWPDWLPFGKLDDKARGLIALLIVIFVIFGVLRWRKE